MTLLKQKVLTKCSSDVKLFFLLCDYVVNFIEKDSDKEHEEESDYTEEGNYTIFVCSAVSLVRHRNSLACYISSKVLWYVFLP